ncbi:hypothetical protein BV25DRAFT_1919480 [Artomyces pyxidatus]|uniref:Uncharacterized protein n=1 Tax=Artomyces pyxidatus TaxID=48021 RepID=A0ACB8SPU8_9AGAM|nr:hypothetical protein BV25DRAFT_1919480 [Artomyces pyxidatus]
MSDSQDHEMLGQDEVLSIHDSASNPSSPSESVSTTSTDLPETLNEIIKLPSSTKKVPKTKVPDTSDQDEAEEKVEKKTRGKKGKGKKKASETSGTKPPSSSPLEFNVALFTYSEMQKAVKKRSATHSYMKVQSDEPFDTWKALLLVKIDETLKPKKIDFENYSVLFTIPRYSIGLLPLCDQDAYEVMIARGIKAHNAPSSPAIQIVVQEQISETVITKASSWVMKRKIILDDEDHDDSDNGRAATKPQKKPKSKVPRASDLDPANQQQNDNILKLQNRWACHKPGCNATGHCFVDPITTLHFPLSFKHFSVWSAAMVKGNDEASIDKPPNHKAFDALSKDTKGSTSIMDQRIKEANAKQTLASSGSVSYPPSSMANAIPPQFMDVLANLAAAVRTGPTTATATATATTSAPATTATSSRHDQSQHLLPLSLDAGARLPISDFCRIYDLDDGISRTLTENKFKYTSSFRHILIEDLKGMGLALGEIAELREAVLSWAKEDFGIAGERSDDAL